MKLIKICKCYNRNKNNQVKVLTDLSAEFHPGKMYAIMGRSGSGKTTLINILGLLDSYDEGQYFLENNNVESLNETAKAKLRNEKIGFVFQTFFLDNNLTSLENVMLPSIKNKIIDNKKRKERAMDLLKKLEIDNRANHYPDELSGGEMQRVAIARALMNDTTYIIADEPTGNLDVNSEKKIFEILRKISKEGKCVIVVSHNPLIEEYADITYQLEDGKLK